MGITEYNNYLKTFKPESYKMTWEERLKQLRDDIMKEAQRPSDKEAKKIYDIEKTMALTVFKKYYPDAIIDFKEAPILNKSVLEVEHFQDTIKKQEAKAAELKAEAEAKVQADIDRAVLAEEADKAKAIKKAKLEAELKALDES